MSEGLLSSSMVSQGLAAATETAALVLPAVQEQLVKNLKQKRARENQK